MDEEPKRKFTGVWLPAQILDNESLTLMQKVLYADIASFGDDCFMSNASLAARYKTTERNIQKNVSALIDAGFVKRRGFDGRKRYLVAAHIDAMLPRTNGHPSHEQMDTSDTNYSSPIDNNIENKLVLGSKEPKRASPRGFGDVQVNGLVEAFRKHRIPVSQRDRFILKRIIKKYGYQAALENFKKSQDIIGTENSSGTSAPVVDTAADFELKYRKVERFEQHVQSEWA